MGAVTDVVSPVAVDPGIVVSQPAQVVTTVPAVMDPPMMMTSFLPVIFAVAVVKALMLGW